MPEDPRIGQLLAEVQELRQQLHEATTTLDAIRNGDVDALVVSGADGDKIYTLDREEHPYRVLIESMQQGAATLSADGTILFCNRCLAEMLDVPQEKVSGSPLQQFVAPADRHRLEAMLRKAQTSHSVGEISFQVRPGILLPVQLAVSVLPLPGTVALGLVATDLTDQKRQEELLAAHRRKDDFLAILSHELRNPLAAIRNAVQILGSPTSSDGQGTRSRDMIQRQVGILTRLVDELLDVSRINQGKIQLRKEPLELSSIIHRAAETVRPSMEARRHTLSVTLPPEPLWLDADSTRLEQVLVNLLNNAAKYTETGGQVWVSAERRESEVILTVKDTGVGIAPDLLPRIFELFTQADHSLDRSQGGLGIGLTLARNLVTMHGGSIRASSDGLGKGSAFTVRLPLLPEPPAPPENVTEENGQPASQPLRVLVVDDNRDAGDSLAMLLEDFGHQAEAVYSGGRALEATPRFQPNVVLLDIGLPDMNGFQVAQRMRQQPGGQDLFIVAVTGYGQEEHRRRALTAGFDHHLIKPVDPDALEELLRGRGPATVLRKDVVGIIEPERHLHPEL